MATPSADARAVLDYWFGAPGDAEHGQHRALWFQKRASTDTAIRERFGALVEAALAGGLTDWDATPEGTLARILLLDQFTRNIYRDTARAFSGDALALAAAEALCAHGEDQQLMPVARVFAWLPFEHAEDLAQQDRAVALFATLRDGSAGFDSTYDYALRHREVIARFGRFPHRNGLLGRTDTAEEAAFLATPGSGF